MGYIIAIYRVFGLVHPSVHLFVLSMGFLVGCLLGEFHLGDYGCGILGIDLDLLFLSLSAVR